ncbi:ABC transporter substrate-binding protein [Marinomonas ostreistagni]|nr:sugar ABC transporter substrate-binding protein [Marinomonas ostreistagni]
MFQKLTKSSGMTALALSVLAGAGAGTLQAETLTIATVNNADMIIMQELSPKWEKKTGNKLNWVILEENVLRQRVTTDIATNGGTYDIITIGAYEAPLWGKNNWLVSLDDFDSSYNYDDIFPTVRNGLTADGHLYAVPFYAESSFTFYRKDLFKAAGLTMPANPTWTQIEEFAAKLHKPDQEQYGICLRGKAGWGDNMAVFGTMVNAFGGRWFDMNWNPELDSPEWLNALTFYTDIVQKYGAPGTPNNGHNENRAMFASGKCAIWVDATSAAGYIYNPKESSVADVTGFASAPSEVSEKGNGWFWAWALSVPKSSKNEDVAKDFLAWATSEEYINLVGEEKGWVAAPPGTRKSTYANSDYINAAPFAKTVQKQILSADPANPSAKPVPYTGVQFVAIPEFQGIGTYVGQMVSASLAGTMSPSEVLKASQNYARQEMTRSGYIK